MITLFSKVWGWGLPPSSNPARELALIGVEKRKATIKETARRIREELGLPPLEALR